jgi:hypothetical protein
VSQCRALLYRRGSKIGYYCVRDVGHAGEHQTDHGERFTEAQATYFNPPDSLPNPLPPKDSSK